MLAVVLPPAPADEVRQGGEPALELVGNGGPCVAEDQRLPRVVVQELLRERGAVPRRGLEHDEGEGVDVDLFVVVLSKQEAREKPTKTASEDLKDVKNGFFTLPLV